MVTTTLVLYVLFAAIVCAAVLSNIILPISVRRLYKKEEQKQLDTELLTYKEVLNKISFNWRLNPLTAVLQKHYLDNGLITSTTHTMVFTLPLGTITVWVGNGVDYVSFYKADGDIKQMFNILFGRTNLPDLDKYVLYTIYQHYKASLDNAKANLTVIP